MSEYCTTKVCDLFEEFETLENVMAGHCCNTQCVMGAGIALAVRRRYPLVFASDKATRNMPDKLGEISWVELKPKKYFVNLYGQPGFGRGRRNLNYEAIFNALSRMYVLAVEKNVKTILLPFQLGSNLAGGSFHVVQAMIEHHADLFGIQTKICKLPTLNESKDT